MDQESVVRWVPSQTPIPALRELIREAERDRNARQPSLSGTDALPAQTPLPSVHRKPLPASARARQTSHPTQEDEPEALAFVELLKDAFKQLDENSRKKQRLVARTKEKQREHSLVRSHGGTTYPLTKTSSASAISAASPSTPPLDYGCAMAKASSLGSRVDIVSGKSTPSLPSHSLNPKPASAPQLPVRASSIPSIAARRDSSSVNGDSPMQEVIDLTQSDMEWERPISAPTMRTQTDVDSDVCMDVSLFLREPPLTRIPARAPAPKPNPQFPELNTASRPPPETQRTRIGPPVLGMRRPAYHPSSQYSSSQGTKGVTVPRFKPPLLTNSSSTSKNGTGTKPTATTRARPPPRDAATKVAVDSKAAQKNQDPDSSFDVSFDMDVDALEEAMKAYD